MPAKFDGVVEAVRYAPGGKILLVRAYERRGPTFSDQILISRETLLTRLASGAQFVTGRRQPGLGSTFETGARLRLVGGLITTSHDASRDTLESVPEF